MKTETRTFTQERATKNTIRYAEDTDGKPPIIGTLYVQKWFAGQATRLKVTIEIATSETA